MTLDGRNLLKKCGNGKMSKFSGGNRKDAFDVNEPGSVTGRATTSSCRRARWDVLLTGTGLSLPWMM